MAINNIELHIEQLVLHGFNYVDRHSIGESVQRELTRLIAERGVPSAIGKEASISQLDAGNFNVMQGSRPNIIGSQVALSVYGSMK